MDDLINDLRDYHAHLQSQLAIAEKATPGLRYVKEGCEATLQNQHGLVFPPLGNCEAAHDDAAFIAAARTGWPESIRAQKRMLDALESIAQSLPLNAGPGCEAALRDIIADWRKDAK